MNKVRVCVHLGFDNGYCLKRHTTIVCKSRSHKQKLSLKKKPLGEAGRWSVKAIKFERKQAVASALSKFKRMTLGEDMALGTTKQKAIYTKARE